MTREGDPLPGFVLDNIENTSVSTTAGALDEPQLGHGRPIIGVLPITSFEILIILNVLKFDTTKLRKPSDTARGCESDSPEGTNN